VKLCHTEESDSVWPRFSVVAKYLLSISVASSSSERVFSNAGRRIINDRQCQLKSDTVDGLLFLHGLKQYNVLFQTFSYGSKPTVSGDRK